VRSERTTTLLDTDPHPFDDWFRVLAAEQRLAAEQVRQLHEDGFIVTAGPVAPLDLSRLSTAYDAAMASAAPEDVKVSKSTRVQDFVNRGPEFDPIYLHEPLLGACCSVIGRPFKLSTMQARTLGPGTPDQGLHVDVPHGSADWPLVGFILMVDAFAADNGATRFVPGSHRTPTTPEEVMEDPTLNVDGQVLACGPAGSMIVFNGSTWHGHSANRSARRRRSIQGAFIPREGRQGLDQAARIRPETLLRLGPLARYLLDLPGSDRPK